MMQPMLEVFPTADELMRAAAERFVRGAAETRRSGHPFVVALAGGSTPGALYALLATDGYAKRVDWRRVHALWGDERCVPPDDAASNYRLARETLLDRVPVLAENIHRIHGEDEPVAAAAAYDRELRRLLERLGRPLDLVLLGMGDNGHTASLFPGAAAIHERERWVVADRVAATPAWRVTFTPVIINAAADVTFLVSGAGKAAMLHQVLDGPYQPDVLPAQVVAPANGRLGWLVDAPAAARLEGR